MTEDTPRYTKTDLLKETARISWQELERQFARGVVLQVDAALDLVEVATCFANDEQETVEGWLAAGQVRYLPNEVARDWSQRDADLWATVVAPWVVVQEKAQKSSGG